MINLMPQCKLTELAHAFKSVVVDKESHLIYLSEDIPAVLISIDVFKISQCVLLFVINTQI